MTLRRTKLSVPGVLTPKLPFLELVQLFKCQFYLKMYMWMYQDERLSLSKWKKKVVFVIFLIVFLHYF